MEGEVYCGLHASAANGDFGTSGGARARHLTLDRLFDKSPDLLYSLLQSLSLLNVSGLDSSPFTHRQLFR